MEIGTVRQVDIGREMQEAYLDYAMSVIISRALPDVRDGLKPVHRRILYAMHDMGLYHDKPYKKSARIVGEVLGKYHPHGDAAVYEAMARMAQDFSMRYLLVDGQGNFGSVDGDPPAAMRYTEARLAPLAMEMLNDIDKDTVDFVPNFDDTLQEPTILPANIPNLLINGSSGIAVAMSTNIPPHNLGEVCDALIYMIDHANKLDEVTVEDLMQFIKGPDFPTGGVVYRYRPGAGDGNEGDALRSAYAVGRGNITVQAKAHIEEMSRNRHRIVVTELPYQVSKSNLIERIAELVRDGRLEGITDLRDESDRQGMRLCIELTRTVDPREVLAQLFRLTPMQSTFNITMLALVDGEPRLLSLKRMLQHYLDHRREIVTRRSRYELERARERAHILEGLLIALANLDEVIAIIRRSQTADTARKNLRSRFKLTEVQAQAILDMPLRRLAALERRKLEEEHREKVKLIRQLESILRSPKKILALIREELQQIKAKYADPRRTQIVERAKIELTARDLLPEEDVLVVITSDGLLSRCPLGEGIKPSRQWEKAPLHQVLVANTRDDLFLFTTEGRAVSLPVHQIPQAEIPSEGEHMADMTSLWRRHKVATALAIPVALRQPQEEAPGTGPSTQEAKGYLFLATREGKVKRVALADFLAARGEEFVVMNVDEGDELGWAALTTGGEEVLLVTRKGHAIRFSEQDVRPMGLSAGGVAGIKLDEGDQVVAMDVVQAGAGLFVATSAGYGKWTALAEYPSQKRYGAGVVTAKLSSRTGNLVGGCVVKGDDEVMLVSAKGAIKKLQVRNVPRMGRATQGRVLMPMRGGDNLAKLVCLVGREGKTEIR
jgi:DNA gyrase subunit A